MVAEFFVTGIFINMAYSHGFSQCTLSSGHVVRNVLWSTPRRKSDRIFKRLSDLYTKYPPVKGKGDTCVQYRVDSRHDLSPLVENGMD